MTEKGRLFLETVSADDALMEKFSQIRTEDRCEGIAQAVALAAELGFDVTAEDLAVTDGENRRLEEDELSAVVGGKAACACPGAGYGHSWDETEGTCVCYVGGAGQFYYHDDKGKEHLDGFCRCFFAGGGGAD